MANQSTARTWLLDTAGVIEADRPVHVAKMIWKPSAASQTLLVQNGAGGYIWGSTSLTGTPAGDQTWDNPSPNMPFIGFKLATLTATGTLQVVTY
jgi:hypothetical protein